MDDKSNWLVSLIESHKIFKWIALLIALCVLCICVYLTISIIILKQHHILFGQDINTPTIDVDTSKKDAVSFFPKINSPQQYLAPKAKQVTVKQSSKKGKNEAIITNGNNNTVIGGENNTLDKSSHIINGENKGINGDVNISNEKQLNQENLNQFVDFVNKLYKEKPYAKKCFTLSTTSQTNGGKFALQLTDFLLSQGFTMQGGGLVYGPQVAKGVSVDIDSRDSCLKIIVGVL
jgi:hypothetical protein